MVPSVKNIVDIEKLNNSFITSQYWFTKSSTFWEKNYYWDTIKLNNVKIDLEQIDRVYEIFQREFNSHSMFYLVARMNYNGKFLYVELEYLTGLMRKKKDRRIGNMFISLYPNLFINESKIPNNIKKIIENDEKNH